MIAKSYIVAATFFLLGLLSTRVSNTLPSITAVHAQFNEPPGQRREQTYRVVEYELSNINQHYPGDLRYYCTFRGKWSAERHPNDFPKAASWSAPIMISHTKDWRMWTGTETVTAGVEYTAEQGFPTIMYNEFLNAGYETLHMTIGDRMYNTTDSQNLPPINVTYSHPWLSAMTKIEPSPDWFVGFSDFRSISYDTETFYNRVVIQSYVWDAGTDDGQNYHSFDLDLDPQLPCMRFCVPPHVGAGGYGTIDSNVQHAPGFDQIHHPTGNTAKCPDRSKGRIQVPRGGQFLDYSASYIPFPAEYECVLRVGDGEVYAGNAFDESQIRPPMFVARPNDDYLDGISPYDQPAYDNYVDSLNGDPVEEEEPWNRNLLWLLVLLLLCCCPCVIFVLYLWFLRRKQRDGAESVAKSELHLDLFMDEGVLPEDGREYDDQRERRPSFTYDNTDYNEEGDEYEDEDESEPTNYNSQGRESQKSMNSKKSMSSSNRDYYAADSGHGLDATTNSTNTGASSSRDDYDSWLASQRVSQQVEYESSGDEDSDDGYGGGNKKPRSKALKPPSMSTVNSNS